MSRANVPRSYLFVPGNRPERFGKALASGADTVVIDLEDAVVADAKPAARQAVDAWYATADEAARAHVALRINETGSPFFADDLALVRRIAPAAVMLAKVESPSMIGAVRDGAPATAVLALIESARGLHDVERIAAAPGVARLVFGTLDFALDLDLDIGGSCEPLAHAAARIVVASRLAGLPSPVAGVTPQIDDPIRLDVDLGWERRHGFAAKLCIHPRQVDAVHAALRPDDAEVAWARRVVDAAAASTGAVRLDGRMIDRPVVLRAERTLARASMDRDNLV